MRTPSNRSATNGGVGRKYNKTNNRSTFYYQKTISNDDNTINEESLSEQNQHYNSMNTSYEPGKTEYAINEQNSVLKHFTDPLSDKHSTRKSTFGLSKPKNVSEKLVGRVPLTMTFSSTKIPYRLSNAITTKLGFLRPTPIQVNAANVLSEALVERKSSLYTILSLPGKGKTLAYLIPIITSILNTNGRKLFASDDFGEMGASANENFGRWNENYRNDIGILNVTGNSYRQDKAQTINDTNNSIIKPGLGTKYDYSYPKNHGFEDPERREKTIYRTINKLSPLAVIIVPSNHLALQVFNTAAPILEHVGIKAKLYANSSMWANDGLNAVSVVICTPISLQRKYQDNLIDFRSVQYAVVDDMDYCHLENTTDIIHKLIREISIKSKSSNSTQSTTEQNYMNNKSLKILFVGASLSQKTKTAIESLYGQFTQISCPNESFVTNKVSIEHVKLKGKNKPEKINTCIDVIKKSCVKNKVFLIFCKTDENAEALTARLRSRKYNAIALGSNSTLDEKLSAMNVLCNVSEPETTDKEELARIPPVIYVTSGVFSYGVDTRAVDHVILFDAPSTITDYVNKVGRTGRAGGHGKMTILTTDYEQNTLNKSFEKART